MYSSVALKIFNTEQERIAYNVYISDVASEDGYIVKDIAESYKELKDKGNVPVMEVHLEAICDGKVLQKANKRTKACKIFTAEGQEALDKIVDSVEGLGSKYQPVLYKNDYALLS